VRAHKRIVSFLLAIVLIGSIVSVGIALNNGPTVPNFTPGDGAVLNTPDTFISFTVTDSSSPIKNSAYYIKVNGTEISSSLQYKGHYDSTNYVVDSYNEATVTGNLTGLEDGVHTVEVQAMNETGTAINKTWNFTVAIAPVISRPSPDSNVTTKTPVLSAYATDNTGLASAVFTIDGQTLNGQIDITYGRISAQVPTTLADGSHNVALSVSDSNGNVANTQWQFKVDTQLGLNYPDMQLNGNAACWACHSNNFSFTAGRFNLAGKHITPF
jgi:hypothetical protein